MDNINFITIREEGNYAEQFNCKKVNDAYACVYVDNGQIQHSCVMQIPCNEMDVIIRGCIGFFPSGKSFVNIIVNEDVFARLVGRMSLASANN